MLVSIIIPIYNVEEFIEDCLESVYQQTYNNIEVILINDCTQDNSMHIAKSIALKYKDKYPTTILNHDHNKGISEARNSGIKVAKGDYLYFIDSDDAIISTAIATLMNITSLANNVEIIEGEYLTGTTCDWDTINNNYITHEIFLKDKAKTLFLTKETVAWNILIKRSFIQKNSIAFVPDIILEDKAFRHSIVKELTSYATITAITYFYRKNNNSITHILTKKHFSSLIQILQMNEYSLRNNTYNIKNILINDFCTFSFNYWSYFWRNSSFHHSFYKEYSSIIRLFCKNQFKNLNFYNILLLSPAFLPYYFAKYFVKIIWKVRDCHIFSTKENI